MFGYFKFAAPVQLVGHVVAVVLLFVVFAFITTTLIIGSSDFKFTDAASFAAIVAIGALADGAVEFWHEHRKNRAQD